MHRRALRRGIFTGIATGCGRLPHCLGGGRRNVCTFGRGRLCFLDFLQEFLNARIPSRQSLRFESAQENLRRIGKTAFQNHGLRRGKLFFLLFLFLPLCASSISATRSAPLGCSASIFFAIVCRAASILRFCSSRTNSPRAKLTKLASSESCGNSFKRFWPRETASENLPESTREWRAAVSLSNFRRWCCSCLSWSTRSCSF